jgi:hypothetical protein
MRPSFAAELVRRGGVPTMSHQAVHIRQYERSCPRVDGAKRCSTASIAAGGWNVYVEPYTWLVEDNFGGRVDGIWAANGSGYAQIVELV